MNIEETIKIRREKLTAMKIENGILQKHINVNTEKIDSHSSQMKVCKEALTFLEDLANSRRSNIKSKIETILTEGLRMVYGENYHVELTYCFKNNRSHMDIEVVKKTPLGDVQRTMDGFGGGVSDCISVPLRLLVLLGSRQTDKVCILDEAYKHVDIDRVENVAQFIKSIANKLGIQVILLSHHEIMQNVADTVFQMQDNNGKSSIKIGR